MTEATDNNESSNDLFEDYERTAYNKYSSNHKKQFFKNLANKKLSVAAAAEKSNVIPRTAYSWIKKEEEERKNPAILQIIAERKQRYAYRRRRKENATKNNVNTNDKVNHATATHSLSYTYAASDIDTVASNPRHEDKDVTATTATAGELAEVTTPVSPIPIALIAPTISNRKRKPRTNINRALPEKATSIALTTTATSVALTANAETNGNLGVKSASPWANSPITAVITSPASVIDSSFIAGAIDCNSVSHSHSSTRNNAEASVQHYTYDIHHQQHLALPPITTVMTTPTSATSPSSAHSKGKMVVTLEKGDYGSKGSQETTLDRNVSQDELSLNYSHKDSSSALITSHSFYSEPSTTTTLAKDTEITGPLSSVINTDLLSEELVRRRRIVSLQQRALKQEQERIRLLEQLIRLG